MTRSTHPYIKLRPHADGGYRPRFEPGPRQRALGFEACDLRHPDGRWFTVEEVASWATVKLDEIREARLDPSRRRELLGKRPRRRHIRSEGRKDWIYFLVVGDWVKIGFSREPVARTYNIETALPTEATMMLALPGSVGSEQRLHHLLSFYNHRGEWFRFVPAIRKIMLQSLAAGELTIDEKALPRSAAAGRKRPPVATIRSDLSQI